MIKTAGHIKSLKRIALIWFLLFSFSPCAIKAVVLDSIDTEFFKTLNKTKATSSLNYCQFVRQDSRQTTVVQPAKIKDNIHPIGLLDHQPVVVCTVKASRKYSKLHTGNSPPKYILFKRWKFDVV